MIDGQKAGVMRRGEYLTPDGDRVIVELEVSEGELAAVRVHADFVVQPASALPPTLDAIVAGLTGAPSDLDGAALAARVRAAVPFPAELVRPSPEAVAQAVRHAIEGERPEPPPPERIGSFTLAEIDRLTADWTGFPWRLLPERPLSPALNVAVDEVLTDRVARGERPPTLRFWRWTDPAVIIGRCQSLANEVDAVAAQERGFQVVRRLTGGGAMFIQPQGAITYSLYLPETAVAGLSIRQSYEVCDAWVIRALRRLGVEAHHVPINDIAWREGKIGGAAQARRRGVVLHHTTLAYDLDAEEMLRVLRLGRERLRERSTPSAPRRVSPLVRQTPLSREAIVAHLTEAFRSAFGGEIDELTTAELAAAERLAAAKYANPTWTAEFA